MGCGAHSSIPQPNDVLSPSTVPPYLRKQLIGKGTFGQVYLCLETATGIPFAMKVIRLTQKSKDHLKTQITELKSEISMLKKLTHPNIVNYHHFCVTPDLTEVEIIMDLLPHGTLRNYLDQHGPLT
jgi:mitogen-activated protein kinase kinase kinase